MFDSEATTVDPTDVVLQAAQGNVLVLGGSDAVISRLCRNPAVTRMWCYSQAKINMRPDHVETLNLNPFRAQRRDIGHEPVDFLYADLWSDPFDMERVEGLRRLVREFRPTGIGYRYQEIDVVAQWLAIGRSLDEMTTAHAIDVFRMDTGLRIEPRNDEYAKVCRAEALRLQQKRRAEIMIQKGRARR